MLQKQFAELWQSDESQWDDGAVGLVTSLFCKAPRTDVQAPIAGPSSAKERSEFVRAHRAAAVLDLDEYPRFLQAKSIW